MNFIKNVGNPFNGFTPNDKSAAKYLAIATVLVSAYGILLRIFKPLVLIFCLNTLFKTGIEYNFTSWLAALILMWFISITLEPLVVKKEAI